jgi:hypothetical protein
VLSLKSVPVWVWAFVYLASIPAFAFIYWTLPGNQFYHSTVQYEQSLQLDAGDLLEQVRSTLIADFREANHGDTTEFNGWKINITELQIYALRPTIDRIGIKMTVNVTKATPHGPIFEHIPFEASYSSSEKSFSLNPDTGQRTFYKALTFDPPAIKLYDPNDKDSFDYGVLFPHADGSRLWVRS